MKLTAAVQRIEDMTKFGGSLVQAYCASHTLSRNTAGATEDCAVSGYTCDQVSGACHRRATMSDHCGPGHLFDPTRTSCVSDRTPPPEEDD